MSNEPSDLGRAVNDVVEKTQILVREEIELAKAEVTEKVSKLIKGVIVGAVAGIFAVVGLLFLLHAASYGAWDIVTDEDSIWLGYLIVAVLLFALGGVAGLLAARFIKKGSPPKPSMALEEAQLIKETYSAPSAAHRSAEAHR
jgi:uncharacterized membrane protein YqjE